MRGITIFSKNTGLEILGDAVEKKNNKYGAVTLRFFEMENGKKSIRFILTPIEAFKSSLVIGKVAGSAEAIKIPLTHKYESESGEIVTTLTFEKWVRENKSGYALLIKRDDRSINVPVDEGTLLYVGEFLRYLSTQQAWVNPIETEEEPDEEESAENPETVTETEEVVEPASTEVVPTPEPEPAQASAPTVNSDLIATGTIEAVRKDKKGLKIGNDWFSINDRTKVTGVPKKGSQARVTYRNGNGVKFANIIEVSA
jgi:hypothetical protein